MILQNRVTPFGEIVAEPWRGALTGNRGILHDDDRRLGVSRWKHQNWVCCALAFRGRHRHVMPLAPKRWTALFFWDEAAALAAGHRPCGECRHRDHRRFMSAWQAADLPGSRAAEVDRVLHAARVTRRREQVRYRARAADLPDGTFVQIGAARKLPMLLCKGALFHLSPGDGGYLAAGPPPDAVTVLTPRPTVAVLAAGYRPMLRGLP